MNKISKFAGVFVAVAFAVAVATPASALTSAQLADLLKGLGVSADVIAAVTAAQGGSTAPTGTCGSFTKDLTLGSTGAEVVALQDFLVSKGHLTIPAGVSKGYFGAMTQSALAKYQTANGISPAAGYFGPMTRAKVSANCGTNPGTPGTPGSSDLQGGAGDITLDALSTYSNESVKAGEEEAKVMAADVEADDESDVELTSVKVEFEQTTADDSEDITDYIETVQVLLDGEVVGEADASDFSENSDVYTKSISLNDAVIEAGETAKLVIAVTAQGNLDSGDIDTDAFTVDVLSVRFTDGEGVTTTETPSANSLLKNFDFEDLATSGDVKAKFTENEDNPDATVVEVDETADTNDVLLLAVDFKAQGSDMTVDQLTFDVTPTGANANVMVKEYKLVVDGEEIDSVSAGSIASAATGLVVFDDLEDDFEVGQDDTVTIEVLADINDLDGTFGNGDSIVASLTSTGISSASSTIEDENGDTVTSRTGSVTGNAQTFYADGIVATVVGTPTAVVTTGAAANIEDSVEYTIKFEVTSFGADAYISNATTTDFDFMYTGVLPVLSAADLVGAGTKNGDSAGYYYKVAEGTSREFTYTVILTASSTGDATVSNFVMDALGWGTTTATTQSYGGDLDDFRYSGSKLIKDN